MVPVRRLGGYYKTGDINSEGGTIADGSFVRPAATRVIR